ncbi:hypothetical protein DOTSEDRAFT_34957 [Dothistroma septosporum NZE10]|uniref:GRF-type domain-containing protein n=1 Tax=Dothistroma septosporum (strain NZE10 / CBS 128990) TaxID=675120 RepID=N1PNQ4_DOTSN|nr:hypothetical protein DOTSEDRAFT_34957 [Dothistroma septosporum NZE10]
MTETANMATHEAKKQEGPPKELREVSDVDRIANALETTSLGHVPVPLASSLQVGGEVDGSDASEVKLDSLGEASVGHLPIWVSAAGHSEPVDGYLDSNLTIGRQSINANKRPTNIISPTWSPYLARKTCLCCRKPAEMCTVSMGNENGNRGRPYWVCTNKRCMVTIKSSYENGWVSWADDKGLDDENPAGYCDVASRQDRICKDEGKKGWGFWTCAEGRCDYYSEDRYGIPNKCGVTVNLFVPFLL